MTGDHHLSTHGQQQKHHWPPKLFPNNTDSANNFILIPAICQATFWTFNLSSIVQYYLLVFADQKYLQVKNLVCDKIYVNVSQNLYFISSSL